MIKTICWCTVYEEKLVLHNSFISVLCNLKILQEKGVNKLVTTGESFYSQLVLKGLKTLFFFIKSFSTCAPV